MFCIPTRSVLGARVTLSCYIWHLLTAQASVMLAFTPYVNCQTRVQSFRLPVHRNRCSRTLPAFILPWIRRMWKKSAIERWLGTGMTKQNACFVYKTALPLLHGCTHEACKPAGSQLAAYAPPLPAWQGAWPLQKALSKAMLRTFEFLENRLSFLIATWHPLHSYTCVATVPSSSTNCT